MSAVKRHPAIATLFFPVIVIVILSAQCGSRQDINKTAEYLRGIEIQYETSGQRKVIKEALEDMLSLDEAALRSKRYPDTFGTNRTISLDQIMRHHFVPDDSRKTPGPDFYKDLHSPEARKLIEDLLSGLRE